MGARRADETAMNADSRGFDLAAAWSRRAGGDMKAFMAALAARLEPALPGRIGIERRRDGLFSAASHVSGIAVRFDDAVLTLALDHGSLRATRAKMVRGVTIKSEEVPVPAWLDDVVGRTRALGTGAGEAHAVLHDFLMS